VHNEKVLGLLLGGQILGLNLSLEDYVLGLALCVFVLNTVSSIAKKW